MDTKKTPEPSGGIKIVSLQENLKQALFHASHITGKNINLPILNNVLVRAEEANIKIISTNLEQAVISTIRGKIEKAGQFTVDAKIFSDCISLLPNKKVELEQKETSLSVDCDNYKAKIRGQAADEFPLIPEVDKKSFYSARTEDFKKAIAQVIFAVAMSETRVELAGVLFSFAKNSLTLAATDSYRLAEKKLELKSNSQAEKKIIVPAKTLQELVRILSGSSASEGQADEPEIKFYLSDNQILFEAGAVELVSRLIEGQYPDYQQIIPTSHKTSVVIDKNELTRAVKLASLFSKSGINDINLDFPAGKNQVIVSSVSGQTGENITNLQAKVSGDDNSLVVNYRYFLDGLANIDGEFIKIQVIDGNTPCIMQAEKDKDYLYIVMPIKQ